MEIEIHTKEQKRTQRIYYNKFQNHRNEANYFLYKITIITKVRQLLSNKKNTRRIPKNSEIELHSLFLFEKNKEFKK